MELYNKPHLKQVHRQLRSNLTEAEAALWNHLKGKQLKGRKFRRQHSIDNYVLDFCCPEERLAIELDGEIHKYQLQKDWERDTHLAQLGIKVLRFENKLVKEDINGLLDAVAAQFSD